VFRKDALRLWSNIFETSHRENWSMKKKLFVFQRLIFLVSVSQLSTRDLFDFLGNLKIKQDIFFCLEFLVEFDQSNNEHHDIPIPDYFSE